MKNTLEHKPVYTEHRSFTGAPIVADDANLTTLYELPGNFRAALNCRRWKTVRVLVKLVAGTTVDIAPLEVVAGVGAFPSPAVDNDRGFAAAAAVVAGLVDGEFFDVTINGGLLYLRLHAVGAASTALTLFVAGHEVAVSRTGQE